MKKIICIIVSLIISVSCIAVPFCAQAETTYFVDTDFAKNNIEKLKNYVYSYGNTNSDGDKVFQYYNYNYDYNFLVIYETKTGALDFWADFDDMGYVDMYYSYPYVTPDLAVLFSSWGVKATASIDVTNYSENDITFNISQKYGDYSYDDTQNFCNLQFKAALEGWNNCLVINTPYSLSSIGFNNMCTHSFTKSFTPATMTSDGIINDYCYKCGYYGQTNIYCVSNVTIDTDNFIYNGSVQRPNVSVIDSVGNVISADNYTISYSNSNSIDAGNYSLTISLIGEMYTGSKTFNYTISPAPVEPTTVANTAAPTTATQVEQTTTTAVAKPNSAKIKKATGSKKAIALTWAKVKGVKGYQIQLATDKKFKKNKKTVTIKKQKTTKTTVKKLKAKKKYFVRIRTYKTVNGKKVYSSWSKAKTVKTK